jgi:hypothetical protein
MAGRWRKFDVVTLVSREVVIPKEGECYSRWEREGGEERNAHKNEQTNKEKSTCQQQQKVTVFVRSSHYI